MSVVRLFPLRVHEKAELTCIELSDRLEFTLINKKNGKISNRTYYKLPEGITAFEASKIDIIIYHMHNEIGLNLWK